MTVARPFVAWLPPIIMAFWGFYYLYACFEALLAPGRGFEFVYEGANGPVEVSAESYAILLDLRTVELNDVEVVSEADNGKVEAHKVQVAQTQAGFDIEVFQARAAVIRDEDGFFSALNLLPPEGEEKEALVVNVTVDTLELVFRDEMVAPTLTETFNLSEIKVLSANAGLRSRFDLNWDKAGRVATAVELPSEGGLNFQARTAGLQAKPVWELTERFLTAEQLQELPRLEFTSALVSGSASGHLPEEGEPEIVASGTLQATDVTFDTFLNRAQINGDFDYADNLFKTEASIREPGRQGTFDGAVVIAEPLRVVGNVTAKVARVDRLWKPLKDLLPAELKGNNLDFRGEVNLEGDDVLASGLLTASQISWADQGVANPTVRLRATQNDVRLDIERASYYDYPFSGWLALDLANEELTGSILGASDDLRPLLTAYNINQVDVRGVPRVLVSGPISAPEANASFTGFVTYVNEEAKRFDLGLTSLRAEWAEETLTLQRAVVTGQYGVATATGAIRELGQEIDVNVEIGDVNLALLNEELSGFSLVQGQVTGSVDSPVFTGTAAAFDVQYRDYIVPQAETALVFQDKVLSANDLIVRLGLGQVVGAGQYNIETQAVSFDGTATDLFISDYTDQPVFGQVDIPTLNVSGTPQDLVITGQARARNLLAYDIAIEDLTIRGAYRDGLVTLNDLDATVGQGNLTGTGEFITETQTSTFSGRFEGVDLSIVPMDREAADVLGTVSGTFNYLGTPEDQTGSVQGTINGLTVNTFNVGQGGFQTTLDNQMVSFNAEAYSTQGYVAVENGSFNLENKEADARVVASGLGVADIWRSVEANLPDLSRDIRKFADTLAGTVALEATVGGSTEDLAIGVEFVEVVGLQAYGRDLGKVTAQGRAVKEEVQLTEFLWTVDEGTLALNGTWDQDGQVQGTGTLTDFNPGVARAYLPELPEINARINSAFTVTGSAENPYAEGTFTIDEFIPTGREEPLDAALQQGTFTLADKVVNVTSVARYEDLTGNLNAQVPLAAFEDPPAAMASATLTVEPRTLQSLERFVSGLDLQASTGVVGGRLQVEGNAEDIDLFGEFSFAGVDEDTPARLKIDGIDTAVEEVIVVLRGEEDKITLTGEGFSNQGGYFTLNAEADLAAVLEPDTQDPSPEDIPIQGSLNFEEFRVSQRIAFSEIRNGKLVEIAADQPTEGTLYGSINLQGSVAQPVVSGRVEVGGLLVNLPPEFPSAGDSQAPPISPVFNNLQIVALERSKINLGIGNLLLSGTATVNGTTDNLVLRAPLTIQGGNFNLPTTRVALQEGGEVDVFFGEAVGGASVDVNLQGTTRVTVRETSTRYESYVLELNIRGDILEPDGVVLSGSSDPPGLSDDRIRAIIGQQDLIENLAAGVLGTGDSNALTQSLYSLAVPSLTQGLTDSLARSLQLDYLVLDYNPFDLGVIRAGKTLGYGLSIEGSRQLTETQLQPLQWDLQLSYRIPSANRILSRTRLTLGTDESTPWRIGLDYSIRF